MNGGSLPGQHLTHSPTTVLGIVGSARAGSQLPTGSSLQVGRLLLACLLISPLPCALLLPLAITAATSVWLVDYTVCQLGLLGLAVWSRRNVRQR